MSRSRKKTPVYKAMEDGKRAANRKVRHIGFTSQKGNLYRRVYAQYKVIEYRFYRPKWKDFAYWAKYYHRK